MSQHWCSKEAASETHLNIMGWQELQSLLNVTYPVSLFRKIEKAHSGKEPSKPTTVITRKHMINS